MTQPGVSTPGHPMKEFALKLKGRKNGGRLPGSNIISYRLSGASAGRVVAVGRFLGFNAGAGSRS
jgi:hypothetical protein